MAYTSNPHLPRIRREAARLVVEQGWSARKVGRYLGYHHTAIMCWVRYAASAPEKIPKEKVYW